MTHHFKNGDRVAVFNMTLGGRHLFEGYAIIQKRLDTDHHYGVRFEHRHSLTGDPGTYDRFVLLAGQDDPHAYVDDLNKRQAADNAALKEAS